MVGLRAVRRGKRKVGDFGVWVAEESGRESTRFWIYRKETLWPF
jgi:hypothetical protein